LAEAAAVTAAAAGEVRAAVGTMQMYVYAGY